MITYGIIAARSGSKGLPNKNIKDLAGHPLMAYSISFAKALGCDKVICSTDSSEYAEIALRYGAEVPFLRSPFAASDSAMEEDILRDLANQFLTHQIAVPDLIVWLRPTFVFRDIGAVKNCLDTMKNNTSYTSARTVCESESRLYSIDENNVLTPEFDDKNKSMVRRQDIGSRFKVFSTDIIRFKPDSITNDFLGRKVYGINIPKICGLDIDDLDDFKIVEAIIHGNKPLVDKYLHI